MSFDFSQKLKKCGIIPVASFTGINEAVKTAELLLKNSIDILEITLRTDNALEAVKEVKAVFPDMIVGVGSVLSVESLQKAVDCGVSFAVSPCLNMEVVESAYDSGIAFVPGIATPTELHQALLKCSIIKIFPAEHLGGTSYIKAVIAPFKKKNFFLVPTGGINCNNYIQYLGIDEVIACGMSYIVDASLISKGDFDTLDSRMKKVKDGLAKFQK